MSAEGQMGNLLKEGVITLSGLATAPPGGSLASVSLLL